MQYKGKIQLVILAKHPERLFHTSSCTNHRQHENMIISFLRFYLLKLRDAAKKTLRQKVFAR